MKHTYGTAAALLASAVLTTGATGQSRFSHNPNQGPALATAAVYPVGAPSCGPIDITCSQAKNIEPFGSVACENAGVTADNQYYRHFIMADYGRKHQAAKRGGAVTRIFTTSALRGSRDSSFSRASASSSSSIGSGGAGARRLPDARPEQV